MACNCNVEMHVHYVMLAQEYFRESLTLTQNSEKLEKINSASELLNEAQGCGVSSKSLSGMRVRYCEEFIRTAQTMMSSF